jgi:heme-degrading monooxygenase HmoA
VNYSQRFERLMPLVCDVPGFTGIRIHPGNTAADTEGCILLGFQRTAESIVASKAAFGAVYQRISEALLAGDSVSLVVE